MFRKISLTALAIASAVALAPNANASTATGNVSFSQTVAGSCTLSTPTAGSLATSSFFNGRWIMGIWSSASYQPGYLTMTCNESTAISVGDPTPGPGNGANASTPMATSNNQALYTFAAVVAPTSSPHWQCANREGKPFPNDGNCSSIPAGTYPLTVHMGLQFLYQPAPATYVYQTTITLTYN
jgi:hypothetical protein